jgi:hypothetical protein
LALLKTDLPAILKYPILALATYVGSNLLVYAYSKTADSKFKRFDMRRMTVGIFLIGAGVTVTGVAQDHPAQKSLSAMMKVYVFPSFRPCEHRGAPVAPFGHTHHLSEVERGTPGDLTLLLSDRAGPCLSHTCGDTFRCSEVGPPARRDRQDVDLFVRPLQNTSGKIDCRNLFVQSR